MWSVGRCAELYEPCPPGVGVLRVREQLIGGGDMGDCSTTPLAKLPSAWLSAWLPCPWRLLRWSDGVPCTQQPFTQPRILFYAIFMHGRMRAAACKCRRL